MKLFLFLFFFLNISAINAQVYSSNKEVQRVYKTILKDYIEKPYIVAHRSKNKEFKMFNFQRPGNHQLDTNNIGPLDTKMWRGFLNSIDTAQIRDYNFNPNFINKINCKSFLRKAERKLTLSSPVFSDDNNLCVCFISSYTTPENSSGVVYFLEKKDGKWKVVKNIMIYIS